MTRRAPRRCTAKKANGERCAGAAMKGEQLCGPHFDRNAALKSTTTVDPQHRTVGTCRLCSHRVRRDEGRMIRGRWEHIDCAATATRLGDRRAKLGNRARPTTSANPHAVKVIDTTTGEVRYDAPLSTADVDRVIANAARHARAWDERRSHAGGGHR